MTAPSLPIADAPLLRPAARRARLVRWLVTGALAALLAAAVVVAPRGGATPPAPAALGAPTTEVVLDLSGSVSDTSYRAVGRALTRLSRGSSPVGLVLFSDSAEEALPPGTPPDQLVPFARIFTPTTRAATGQGEAAAARPGLNPWYPSFSGGTRISAGIAAAASALRRDHVRGRILLLSDLGDAPDDRGRLRRELVAVGRAGIDLQALPLPNALPADRQWFEKLEGARALIGSVPLRPRPGRASGGDGGFPVALAAVAGLVALALAANELVARSLRWGGPA